MPTIRPTDPPVSRDPDDRGDAVHACPADDAIRWLDAATSDEAVRWLEGLHGAAGWVATAAVARRPFSTLPALKLAMTRAVREAPRDRQLALLHAHPTMLPDGTGATERASFDAMNARYLERFGWPFVLAVGGPRGTGLSLDVVLATLARRIGAHFDAEFAECLRQVDRIAELRMADRLGVGPTRGVVAWDRAAALAAFSDPPFAEQGQLTVTYLTDAHRAVARTLEGWMRDAGFDEVGGDAVGNVVGVYHATVAYAPRVMTGSHFDTVRNAGPHDGRLGILVPIAAVEALHRAGRRLPFAIEVVAFAEEEGQRYKATFLGSRAVVGRFDDAWLDQEDADGVTMRDAMRVAGLPGTADSIATLARPVDRYLGFVEVHVEQGPILNALDLPLGVVTSINGSVRYRCEVTGVASHAGTTPMDARRDAFAAVAEIAVFVERRAAEAIDLVATIGIVEVPGGSTNVVPGRCRFALDVRSTTDTVRDACMADILATIEEVCSRRGLSFTHERTMRAAACPSAPAWQARWEAAVSTLGLPVHRMPSGAGHDAMMLHEVMPQAMLFVRGENGGISHNPLESTTADDMQLAIEAFDVLLAGIAEERPSVL